MKKRNGQHHKLWMEDRMLESQKSVVIKQKKVDAQI